MARPSRAFADDSRLVEALRLGYPNIYAGLSRSTEKDERRARRGQPGRARAVGTRAAGWACLPAPAMTFKWNFAASILRRGEPGSSPIAVHRSLAARKAIRLTTLAASARPVISASDGAPAILPRVAGEQALGAIRLTKSTRSRRAGNRNAAHGRGQLEASCAHGFLPSQGQFRVSLHAARVLLAAADQAVWQSGVAR